MGNQDDGRPAPENPDSQASDGGSPRRGARAPRRGVDHVVEELAAQRRELSELTTTVRDNAGLLAETVPRVGDLSRSLNALTGRVDELAEASTDDDEPDTGPYEQAALTAAGLLPDPGHQVDWHLMSAEQALPAWEALGAWVATVVCGRLGFTRAQLPDCWALHPTAVHALSWAHQLHRVLAGKGVSAPAVAEFHTRWLPHLHGRLTAAIPVDRGDPRVHAGERHGVSDSLGRCRLGHYHRLSPPQRKLAETDLERDAKASGQDSRYVDRLTGPDLDVSVLDGPDGLAAARRALAERRTRAQRHLDALRPHHAHDPARPRYLPVQPADAHPHAEPAADQPAHPSLWIGPFREAAAADITTRRNQHHHQVLDLGLGHLRTVGDSAPGSPAGSGLGGGEPVSGASG